MDAKLNEPFEVLFKVLKATGMWQDGNQSWMYFFAGFGFHLLFVGVYFALVIIYTVRESSFADAIEAIGQSVILTSLIFKWINFYYRIKSIKKIHEDLNSLLEFSKDERRVNHDKVKCCVASALKCYKIYWFCAFFTGVSSIATPITTHKLPFKAWYPYDIEKNEVAFWMTALSQSCSSMIVSTVDVAISFLPIVLMTFVTGLTEELCDRLTEIGRKEKAEEKKKKTPGIIETLRTKNKKISQATQAEVVKCVQIHVKIEEVLSKIQDNFAVIIALQGLFSSIILCTCAYTVSVVSFIKILDLY